MKFLLSYFLLAATMGWAQAPKATLTKALQAETYIGTDAYTNQYFIDEMAFYKQGPDGKYVFKDFSLGPLSKVDIINPLKMMLFYNQTNTVVFVDNRLNEVERINFNNLPRFVNIADAGNAGNNRVWLFNIDSQQLELYDYRQQRALQTSLPVAGTLVGMASNFNYCYLLFEDKLLTFNVYGSFLSEIEISGASSIVQNDENVWLVKGNEVFTLAEPGLHSPKKPSEEKKVPLPEITVKQLHLTQDFLYIYDGKTLHQFANNPPKK
ncbi:MAG TPA: hypothetical protein EYN07_13755 [Flavobacteriaceae bacterium]|nr:hypothetical protein [Flavobacteriaceae bacterium]MAY53802.1 hypothetical protein [Flavobacteriaceae bacterium]HIB49314.1 hypothetical protein [Flavobacteriaceae bacterium]HIO00295.1 hypothetical protein [Flavobacteriaceae bacterium]|tara:strand:- start:75145 stop:75942 length:798 start_codon:yes stop_codon:yes gene_type:complete